MKKHFIFALLLFISLSIFAEVRYVSKKGSSESPYTSWKTACDSLQKCFDYCNNGDTVYVDRGIYRETIFLDNKVLTIIGVDTDECIIDGTGLIGQIYAEYLVVQKKGNIKLKNVTLKKKKRSNEVYSNDYFNEWGELEIESCILDTTHEALPVSGYTRVDKCIFRDVGTGMSAHSNVKQIIKNSLFSIKMWEGAYGHAIINAVWSGSFQLNNNIIYTNDKYTARCIDLCTSTGISIKNNLIYGFEVGVVGSTFGAQPDTVEIVNNTIIYKINDGAGILAGNMPAPIIIKNNLISGFKIGVSFQHFSTNADYNLFHNVTRLTNMPPIGEHNIVADPMFNNDTTFSFDAVDNFRLQKFSPAIDAGDPSILDVDGSRSDIGMFGGPGGISYEYQDFAPKVVKKLTASYEPATNRVKVTWAPNTEADIKEYYVYKATAPILTLDSTKRVAILTDTLFYDTIEQKAYYRVTAVDNTGNQSYPSSEVIVRVTDVNDVSITDNYEYALYQNYPNPFNPTTTISYSLKDESEVRIKIYDITGKLIQTIIVGNKSKGYNETQIDLSNMASGIYLYRLEVTGKGKIPVFNDLKKMVLVK